MRIQTFENKKGLIWGPDPRRIDCETSGVLRIGSAEITVPAGKKEIMPMLFYGATGDYSATFTTADGEGYDLGKVAVRDGRIRPPSETAAELMELRFRADKTERRVRELESLYRTDSLSFLIGSPDQI